MIYDKWHILKYYWYFRNPQLFWYTYKHLVFSPQITFLSSLHTQTHVLTLWQMSVSVSYNGFMLWECSALLFCRINRILNGKHYSNSNIEFFFPCNVWHSRLHRYWMSNETWQLQQSILYYQNTYCIATKILLFLLVFFHDILQIKINWERESLHNWMKHKSRSVFMCRSGYMNMQRIWTWKQSKVKRTVNVVNGFGIVRVCSVFPLCMWMKSVTYLIMWTGEF